MGRITLLRIIKNGFVNFWRNIWLSAAATLIMTVTLIILSILVFLFGITNYSVNSVKERVDISVYLKTGLAENKIIGLKQVVEQNTQVKEVEYISAEAALVDFKERHKNDPLVLQSLEELGGGNPLPATLRVKAHNLNDYPQIVEKLKDPQYSEIVTNVNYEDNRLLIERLNKLLKFVVSAGTTLIVVFSVIAILVLVNTITLTIYNRREEIEIMRLVGATNFYIRGPFVIESLLYSITATLVTSALLVPLYLRVLPQVSSYLSAAGGLPLSERWYSFGPMVLGLFLVALLLSVISSALAMRKYLRV